MKHASLESLIAIVCAIRADLLAWEELWTNRGTNDGDQLLSLRREIWKERNKTLDAIMRKGGYQKWLYASEVLCPLK